MYKENFSASTTLALVLLRSVQRHLYPLSASWLFQISKHKVSSHDPHPTGVQRPWGAEARCVARASAFRAKVGWLCDQTMQGYRIHKKSWSLVVTPGNEKKKKYLWGTCPVLAIRLATCDVLFPGAAQQSSTTESGAGSNTCAGKQLAWEQIKR